jgi:hypothetical protein
MLGATPPLPNMLSWRGAQIKHRDTFTLPYRYKYNSHHLNGGGVRNCCEILEFHGDVDSSLGLLPPSPFHPEAWGSKLLRNVGILPQH